MFKKTHVLALTVAAAGLIGFAAPMANAATMEGPEGGLVNVSNNQVPVQACGNDVNTNGAGAQVLAEGGSAVVPLLSPDSFNKGTSDNKRGCVMSDNQQNRHGEDKGGLVNLSDNQIPVQVCGNDVNTNGAGVQVPLEALAVLVPVLSPGSVNLDKTVNDRGCVSLNNQQNGEHHAKHGKCPCKGWHSARAGVVTANAKQGERPAVSGLTTSKLGGKPVSGLTTAKLGGKPAGGLTAPVLRGNPVSDLTTAALQGSK
jgi:hypothetical protein